jgi:hypothetical protein
VDFTLTTEQETFRAAVQATLQAVDTTKIRRSVLETGVAHHNGLNGALAQAGLLLHAVPGPDRDPARASVVQRSDFSGGWKPPASSQAA